MKIKKGDTVLIIAGDDKGRKGKVIKVIPKEERILVEGINIQKKHVKPRREGEKGQIIEKPGPIHISNAKVICPKCGKPTKIGYVKIKDKKFRVCKICKHEFE
ncbi:50S ribosomal protein L24 [bacterium]|nr:50S ribosomal protein L24 [bacterium]